MAKLTDLDLDNIEAAARGRAGVGPFTHPADVLRLVAEVRRLRAAVAEEREACAAALESRAAEVRARPWGYGTSQDPDGLIADELCERAAAIRARA